MKHRYLTRYEGRKGSRNTFRGWRLCITRRKEVFVRYFTDKEYENNAEASRAAALSMRDELLRDLEANPEAHAELFVSYRKKKLPHPSE